MSARLISWAERNCSIIFILVCFALVAFAVLNRFIQDDAYISFRYARNLASGYGLVWNVGEHVEGYTNFLWTLLMSIPIFLTIDPTNISQLFGLLFFVLTLIVTCKVVKIFDQCVWTQLICLILLGTNYTFSAYATGGLETQLQTCLLSLVVYLSLNYKNNKNAQSLFTFSFAALGALLTRLDSVVLVAPFSIFIMLQYFQRNKPIVRQIPTFIFTLLPALTILVFYFLWKLFFYGELLPNTFYAKTSLIDGIKQGLLYVYEFLLAYALLPFVLLVLFKAKRYAVYIVSISSLVVWVAYIVWAGGDFMEFRFLVPILPIFFVLVSVAIRSVSNIRIQTALVSALIIASAIHYGTFGNIRSNTLGVESIRGLGGKFFRDGLRWDEAGKALERYFYSSKPEERVTISTTAAGAVAYYSNLTTIDMLGLNDRFIARNTPSIGTKPGHQKVAPIHYLIERGVNIIVGHPNIQPLSNAPKTSYTLTDLAEFKVFDAAQNSALFSSDAQVFEIPIYPGYKLRLVYLIQNNFVDKVIESNNLILYPVLK